jgi:hypothetical protein
MRLWQTVLVAGTVTHSMLLNLWLDFSQREGALRKEEEERKEEERKEEERKEEERRVTEHVGVPHGAFGWSGLGACEASDATRVV